MVEVECKNCKNKFKVHKFRIKRGVGYCSKECMNTHWRGFKRSDEFKEKVRKGCIGVNTWAKGKKLPQRSGEKCHFWRGGVSKINRTERQNFSRTIEYKTFRRNVLARDNYTCQICFERTRKGKRVVLQVDHIKPYRDYPELRLEMTNARTVCKPCHYKTDTYGIKVFKFSKLSN